ncbi:Leucine-rich repeat-containing protein 14, partial [Manis javanica]
SMLQFLDPQCIAHLQVDEALLSEVNTCVPQTVHLYNLRVSNIRFTCFTETHFETFLNYLGQLDNLQELDLYALFLKDRLPRLLSVLPPQLKTLTLSYCGLSSIDVTILSQSSQATHLRQLNLSHNQILSEAHEPFQALLEKASGTVPGAKKDQIPDLKPCEHILVRFKMDKEPTGTLLELAAKSLLSNEQAAIHALDELPRDLFVPLFIPAFLGRHKEVLKAMTVHLYNLRVSNIHFTCFTETHFETFLNYLGQLDNLQELDLYALFLKDRLPRLLSVLPPQLKTLTLSYCGLSSIDVTILSQSSQATHLRQLNLSHNQIFSEAHEPFQALLEKASGHWHNSVELKLSLAVVIVEANKFTLEGPEYFLYV